LADGTTDLLCTLRELAALKSKPSMDGAHHYVSHCAFSPDVSLLAFMHCWLNRGQRHTRLLACNLETGSLIEFPESIWVSHYCWMGSTKIIAYANTTNRGRGYYIWQCGMPDTLVVGAGVMTDDGHPQVDASQRWLLADTYQDRFRLQRLILYDLHSQQRHDVATLRIPGRYREDVRCDFHPRWNRAYNAICFDSAHVGERALCTFNIALEN
jgi:hypothetical protein